MSGLLPDSLRGRWYNSPAFDPDDPWAGFAPHRTAVVLVDLINWQAHPDGFSSRTASGDYKTTRCADVVVPALSRVLPAARTAGAAIVHSRLASRAADYADIVPALREYVRAAGALEGRWAAEPLDGLHEPGDLLVTKSGSGAFGSSDLDQVLRNLGVRTVLYAGVVTDRCVLLTAAGGFDLGYEQYLLTDCTAATTAADQASAERLVSGYLARPATAAEAAGAFETS
ncbi:cysteine hydrolase family protein [Amycolatopsis sp. GA6-003]|uniref:cysteine hydrolase family protein n=1 Tax=Amycolatopsis sp. GA6-003 TaxID=2652444 RepID=UPI003916F94F